MSNTKKSFLMVSDAPDDEGERAGIRYEFLRYDSERGVQYFDLSRPALESEITLEAMADMLDHHAENCNAHDFVGAHRVMAALLFREVGREVATRIFRRLSKYDGLHGMDGVCGKGNPEETRRDLGLVVNGEIWHLEPTP